MPSEAEEILRYWFGEGGEFREAWFLKSSGFDQESLDRFEVLHERAASGALDGWRSEPRTCLALVISPDQLPRNMFRGNARMYATNQKALKTARRAGDRAYGLRTGALAPVERMFLYLPFPLCTARSLKIRDAP